MEILGKYVHGSADSLDKDVYYWVDDLPDFQACKLWCDSKKDENANLITIKNGVVESVYKGTPDEVNNSLFLTFDLHNENNGLTCPIKYRVRRDAVLKFIRSTRGILSHLSKSCYRDKIKSALNSANWYVRLDVLNDVDLCHVDFNTLNSHISSVDIKKVIAFQIGQCLGLMEGIEFYTKYDLSKKYPVLKQFLYRQEDSDIYDLNAVLKYFIKKLNQYMEDKIIYGGNSGLLTCIDAKYDVKYEKRIW